MINRPVDDAEQVLSAGFDSPRERCTTWSCAIGILILAVEQGIEGTTRSNVSDTGGHRSDGDGETVKVSEWPIIGDRKCSRVVNHHRAHIIVVIGSSRSMDDNWSADAITVLGEGMAVVPGSAIGASLPGIGSRTSVSSDGALGYARNTILVVGAVLTDAVEVDGGAVVWHLVDDGDLNHITPVGLNDRPGNLSIDRKGKFGARTVEHQGSVGDFKGICASDTGGIVIRVVIGFEILLVAPLRSISRRVAIVVSAVGRWSVSWASRG